MKFLNISVILMISISLVLCGPAGTRDTDTDTLPEEMMGEILQTEPTDATEYANKDKRIFEDFLSHKTKEERLLNIRKLREKNLWRRIILLKI